MQSISLKEKVGQLLAFGIHGTKPGDPQIEKFRKQIEEGLVGGVILYRYNIDDPEQIKNLTSHLKQTKTRVPLFFMLDQEGGKVQRLSSAKGFSDTHSAKYVADNMKREDAVQHYSELGATLKSAGFNFNFAPCVDLDGDPQCPAIGKLERSYSNVPGKVVEYAEAMIEGLASHNVITCIKHFPGHGRVTSDSHVGLVDITDSWTEEELIPFRQIIKDGAADSVMTAHLIHQKVDPNRPITFSKTWVDKLRKDMSFEGVVVSDDLHMGAMIANYTLKEVVINALNAGTDLLIFSNNSLAAKATGIRHDENTQTVRSEDGNWIVPDEDLPQKIYEIIKLAIEEKELDLDIIDRAYQRISLLKSRLK